MRGGLAFSLLAPCLAMAQSPGTFTATGSMAVPRFGHTATLLPNGKVLVAGGSPTLPSAELYDPSTGGFTRTGDMITARDSHTATLLADGRVLIAGGDDEEDGCAPPIAYAELYDPSTGAFTRTSSLLVDEYRPPTALLADGRVFLAGTANAEIYDPDTETFTLASPYAHPAPASWNTVTTLADGRVLLTGCPAAELYDPRTDTFQVTGPRTCRSKSEATHTATLLLNGSVLVVESGPYNYGDLSRELAELYDPTTGAFSDAGPLQAPHQQSAAARLADGTVLLAGGEWGGTPLPYSEVYLPAAGAFALVGAMTTGRDGHTATLLSDGAVLIAGGCCRPGMPASAELYTPAVRTGPPALFSVSGDGQGQGAILHANTSRVTSSSDPAAAGEYLEIYLTGLADGSVIPPLVSIGGRVAEVSYFGKSGYPGVNQINVRVPSGIAPGSAVPVWLIYLGRPSNQVTIGVQ